MKTEIFVEYRIRPVQRFVLTRYHSETREDGRCNGGTETVGEFDNAHQATRVLNAMREAPEMPAPRAFVYPVGNRPDGPPDTEWIVVAATWGDATTIAHYAYSAEEAESMRRELESVYGGTFAVFSRKRDNSSPKFASFSVPAAEFGGMATVAA